MVHIMPKQVSASVENYPYLESALRRHPRLEAVRALSEKLFAHPQFREIDLTVHNYGHQLWDADMASLIAFEEDYRLEELTVAAALVHDSGATIGPYQQHAQNSAKIVNEFFPALGFNESFEVQHCGIAVAEHNSDEHTTDISKFLYDADTLNKGGIHGVNQGWLLQQEFKLTLPEVAERLVKSLSQYQSKGFYSHKAASIDRMMGTKGVAGIELALTYWANIVQLAKESSDEHELNYNVIKKMGLEDGFAKRGYLHK